MRHVTVSGDAQFVATPEVHRRDPRDGRRSGDLPLQQCVRRFVVVVVFEDRAHRASDLEDLMGIAEQISDDSHVVGLGQFDESHDVRALIGEGGMHRVPDTLMAIEHALRARFLVTEIEGVAPVTHELRSPLPALAAVASLQQQPFLAEAIPERSVETIG
jgi:hypothetical protein